MKSIMFTFESIYTRKVGGLSEVPPRLGEELELLGVKTEIYTPNHSLIDTCEDPEFNVTIENTKYCIKRLDGVRPIHYLVGGGSLNEKVVYPPENLIDKVVDFARVLVEYFKSRLHGQGSGVIFHGHDWHSIPSLLGVNKIAVENEIRVGLILHIHLGTRNVINLDILCNKLHICNETPVRGDLGIVEFKHYYALSHGIIERVGALIVDKLVTVSQGYVKDLTRLVGLGRAKKIDYVFNATPLQWSEVSEVIKAKFNAIDPLDISVRLSIRNRLLTKDISELRVRNLERGVDELIIKLTSKYGIVYNEPFKYPGPLLLLVGRLSKQKGFDYLLKSLDKLTLSEPRLRIIIAAVPSSWELDFLKILLEMVLSYPDNLRVLPGMLNRVDLVPLYYAANATLIPSRSEPFGLVALESMASGTPVVASRTGGLINIITDVRAESTRGNGTLFTPGDINDMVESTMHLVKLVEELYKTPNRQHNIRKICLERVRDFNWERSAKKTIEIYNAIFNKM
ncbi:MAG: glycosyltransferase [Desulfurococcaceae archaeon]